LAIRDAPESKSGLFPEVVNGFLRGASPLSFEGEGDNRGEVNKQFGYLLILRINLRDVNLIL
jgi:hypothetical protein